MLKLRKKRVWPDEVREPLRVEGLTLCLDTFPVYWLKKWDEISSWLTGPQVSLIAGAPSHFHLPVYWVTRQGLFLL